MASFDDNDLGPLCDAAAVYDRIEDAEPGDFDALVEAGIEDASDGARFLARRAWTTATVPAAVGRIVAAAAARWASNPSGYSQSRAGDETLGWGYTDDDSGSVHFTKAEVERLKFYAEAQVTPKLVSIPIQAHGGIGHVDETIYVPTNVGSPFPFLVAGEA